MLFWKLPTFSNGQPILSSGWIRLVQVESLGARPVATFLQARRSKLLNIKVRREDPTVSTC